MKEREGVREVRMEVGAGKKGQKTDERKKW